MLKDEYNDVPCETNAEVYEQLRAGGLDERLARHFAHLFIRDPLVMYHGHIYIDDAAHSDHFENIQASVTLGFAPRSSSLRPVDQLADGALQAAAARLEHLVARRVSPARGANDRL